MSPSRFDRLDPRGWFSRGESKKARALSQEVVTAPSMVDVPVEQPLEADTKPETAPPGTFATMEMPDGSKRYFLKATDYKPGGLISDEGGQGIIYAVRDPKTGELFALKMLYYSNETTRQRLRKTNEILQTLGKVDNPDDPDTAVSHINKSVGVATTANGDEALVLELVEPDYVTSQNLDIHKIAKKLRNGETLAPYEVEMVKTDFDIVMNIISTMADVTDYAHERNIYHNDLKPAQVLFDPADGTTKVLDWDNAFIADEEILLDRNTKNLQGTPEFMAPEVLLRVVPDDNLEVFREACLRGEIFSIGASIFTMLTGEFPFTTDALEVAKKSGIQEEIDDQTIRATIYGSLREDFLLPILLVVYDGDEARAGHFLKTIRAMLDKYFKRRIPVNKEGKKLEATASNFAQELIEA